MHILGLANGSLQGNSEILLKAALTAAKASNPDITISWIHVPSIVIPKNPGSFKDNVAVLPQHYWEVDKSQREIDDRLSLYNALLEADAIIIASPVLSHQPFGMLKVLNDFVLGPYADVSEAYRILSKKRLGDPKFKDVEVDPRQVKPRVAAFIAVAGSAAGFPEQWTMALPTMHLLTYTLHTPVVDQVIFPGCANPGSVLLDPYPVQRAKQLGERVASQLGKHFAEVEYLGPAEEGCCPYCHLLKIEFREGNRVTCITCGAAGTMITMPSGSMRPLWEHDSSLSGITLKGKLKHRDDIFAQLGSEEPKLPGIQTELDRWKNIDIPLVPLPSNQEIAGAIPGR